MNAYLCKMGLGAALLVSGWVQAKAPDTMIMSQGWIRPAPPEAPVRAGYVTLRNSGGDALHVDGVHSEDFGAVEIHEMHDVDGVMRMRRVRELELAPGQTLELKPGGLHLMLFRPARPLAMGETVTIILFDGEEVVGEGRFEVRAPQ